MRVYLFLLDLLYSILLSWVLGEITLLLSCLFVFALLLGFRLPTMLLPGVISLRFLLFTILYGLEKCHVFLTIIILYVEAVLSPQSISLKILCPIFLAFIMGCDNLTLIGCDLPWETLNSVNVLSRLYVLTYLSAKMVFSKYETIFGQRVLADQAVELVSLEKEEMSFMKRFSHFTRTNLNGIVNFLSFFRATKDLSQYTSLKEDDDISDGINMYLDTIETSANEITRQSIELVEYYELRNGTFMEKDSCSEIVNLQDVVDYVIRIQRKLRLELNEEKKAKVRFFSSSGDSVPKYIVSDRQQLSKVLMNIVSNALKYTDRGHVKVSLEYDRSKEEIAFKVEDTGIGIKKEILDRVYDPFVKNASGKQSFSVGLVITKSMVNRLGGRIEIESEGEEGKGTKVGVYLPYRPPTELELEEHVLEMERQEKLQHEQDEKLREVRDVLIVEDNIINRKIFQKHIEMIFEDQPQQQQQQPQQPEERIIRRNRSRRNSFCIPYHKTSPNSRVHRVNNLTIHEAEDGVEGLRILENIFHRNPLIITDIDMPNMDGLEFCKRVRSRYGKHLVVYTVTATITGDKVEFCSKNGFDGISFKPIPFLETKRMISWMVSEKNRREELMKKRRDSKLSLREVKKEKLRRRRRRRSNNNSPSSSPTSTPNKKKKKKKEEEEKEEEEEEEEISIISSKDEMFKYLKDVGLTIFTILVTMGLYVQCPTEFSDGWKIFGLSFFYLSVVQYILLLLTRFSAEFNNMMSIIRIWITMVIASEFSFFKLLRIVYLSQFSYIMQANESIESLPKVIFLTLLFYIKIFYYEITRPKTYFTYDHDYTNMVYKVSLVYFMVHVVWLSYQIVVTKLDREERWKEIISERLKIEQDYNLTTSKISHDLSTPASALVVYLEEVRLYLEKRGILRPRKKHDIEEEDDDDDDHSEVIGYFHLMTVCSCELELAIHNFLAACKIKNSMVVTRLVPNVEVLQFIKSIAEKCEDLHVNQKKQQQQSISINIDSIFNNNNNHSLSVKFEKSVFPKNEESSKCFVCMDMVNTRLVILNLLMNSVIHANASKINVVVSCVEDDNNNNNDPEATKLMKISIIDNGIGIPLKYVNQNNNISKSKKDSFHFKERFSNTLGLGLVVSKYLTQELGGSLVIHSSRKNNNNDDEEEEGEEEEEDTEYIEKGTIVEFTFPFKYYTQPKPERRRKKKKKKKKKRKKLPPSFPRIMQQQQEESEESEEEVEEDVHVILRSKLIEKVSILVLDDSTIVVKYLRMFLSKIGFRDLCFAHHEEEGIKAMLDRKFDILISDFNLVNMNFHGMMGELRRRVFVSRNMELKCCLPKIIVCCTGSPEDVMKKKRRDDYVVHSIVSKPIDISSLKNSLKVC